MVVDRWVCLHLWKEEYRGKKPKRRKPEREVMRQRIKERIGREESRRISTVKWNTRKMCVNKRKEVMRRWWCMIN